MKYEIVNNSCRICLSKNKKLRSLYIPEDEDEAPCEMLKQVTGLFLEDAEVNEMLPKNICKSCYLSLSMAHAFRAKALKTDKILEMYLKSLQGRMNNVINLTGNEEMEMNRSEKDDLQSLEDYGLDDESLDDGDANFLAGECLDPAGYPQNIELLSSSKECLTQKNDEENINTLFIADNEINDTIEAHGEQRIEENDNEVQQYIEETDDDELEYELDINEDEQDINECEQFEYEQFQEITEEEEQCSNAEEDVSHLIVPQIDLTNDNKNQEIDTQLKNTKSKKHSNSTQKIRKKVTHKRVMATPKKLKVASTCDVCGNIFMKRSRMLEHRQIHFKDLKYECELCEEKFHMRELLRKHMFSHGSGKPFKCQFCSRTFYYESVKKTHEAVHQGYKPFVCESCGKAFAYAHALKKHKLIHAEIKLYRCNYCNKDFRLQHHMKQHELTRMHQNAVRTAAESSQSSSDIAQDFNDVVLADNENDTMEYNDSHQIIVES